MKFNLKENEVVLKASESDHLNKGEKIAGKLILTNQRIYFRSLNDTLHKFNHEILFNQIKEIIYFKNGFFSKKGIAVITRNDKELKFTMKNRDVWGQMINQMY
jgi:hypothetical protein